MFSQRIKSLRISLSLTQAAFGSRLGVSKQCVSNWEKGSIHPSMEMLIRIAKEYEVSTDFLLGLYDFPSNRFLDVSGLSETQIAHLRLLISDLHHI